MKIAIVEDFVSILELLRTVCARKPGWTVVGEARDGATALDMIFKTDPDIVLLDLELPKVTGFQLIELLQQAQSRSRIIIFSAYCDNYTVFRAERHRVHGFVCKGGDSIETLCKAIDLICAGKTYFSDFYVGQKTMRSKDPHSFDKILSKREIEILSMVGDALTDEEIAGRLRIASRTVETHRHNLIRKLNLDTRSHLEQYARSGGFTLKR